MTTNVNILEIIVVLISTLYILLHVSQSNWQAVLTYAIILLLCNSMILFNVKVPILVSFILAMIISYLTFDMFYINESFKEEKESSEDEIIEMPKKNKEDIEKEEEEEKEEKEEDEENTKIDFNKTLKNSLGALTPEQIKNMTQDTKELMQTQSQLVDTLKTLGPVVQEGIKMMEVFDSIGGNKYLEKFKK